MEQLRLVKYTRERIFGICLLLAIFSSCQPTQIPESQKVSIIETPKRECLINGKIMGYDACCINRDVDYCKDAYEKIFNYIGSSNVYYINGVKNVSPVEIHYFVKKK